MTRFYFVRHCESEKNRDDVAGGPGASLTSVGREQAHFLASTLLDIVPSALLVASPTQQTIETAAIIGSVIGRQPTVDQSLRGAGMGVIGELRQAEVERRFPSYAQILASWRARQIEVTELHIEGMEPPVAFWQRIRESLDAYDAPDVIIVTTRSLMVLAANAAEGHTPVVGGGYRHVDISYGQIVALDGMAMR